MFKHMLFFLPLSACAPHPQVIPPPPPKQQVITKEVPIPVICKVVVQKPEIPIDTAPADKALEDQNALLRSTIAQQDAYIIDLVAAVIGCGGTVQ